MASGVLTVNVSVPSHLLTEAMAQTLEAAAAAFYSEDGPKGEAGQWSPLSTATWLRERAETLRIKEK